MLRTCGFATHVHHARPARHMLGVHMQVVPAYGLSQKPVQQEGMKFDIQPVRQCLCHSFHQLASTGTRFNYHHDNVPLFSEDLISAHLSPTVKTVAFATVHGK